MVPEERHLLLERTAPVPHRVEPVYLDMEVVTGQFRIREVPVELKLVELGLLLGMQELVDYVLVAHRREPLQLRPARTEAGAAHEVSHQVDAVTSHPTYRPFFHSTPTSESKL